VVDGQVGLVLCGEGRPGNWDFTGSFTGITGQEDRERLDQLRPPPQASPCKPVQATSNQ